MPRVEALRTPASPDDVGLSMLTVLPSLSRSSLRILLAHWAGETGWGKAMYNWNVGNSKSGGKSGDWMYLSCTELVPRERVDAMLTDSRVRLERPNQTGAMVELRFEPDHPWSRFQSFVSLDEGVRHYLGMMARSFPRSWSVALRGDGNVEEYARILRSERYYTATVERYVALLKGTLDQVDRRAPEALAAAEVSKPPLAGAAVPRFH